ncbi:hypothetical protein ACFWAY_30320 [Rhodococcus sp. NPDC059968]|uniref:hypothetical protein n=1 Tax=Rhodococcus sp. NPDC059968 TaxID=3347017 RepID=UPI00366B2D91
MKRYVLRAAVCVGAAVPLLLFAPGTASAVATAHSVGGAGSVAVTVAGATPNEACQLLLTGHSQGAVSSSTELNLVKGDGSISDRVTGVAAGNYTATVHCEVEGNISSESITVSGGGGGGVSPTDSDPITPEQLFQLLMDFVGP